MVIDDSVKIRFAKKSDFENIRALCVERFGEGYLAEKDYEAWLKTKELFLVAEDNGAFCGFCYLMPESYEDLAAYMKLDVATVEKVACGKPVLHCRSAALKSDAEHRGVMYRLLSEELKNAKELGFGAAFAPAWSYRGRTPMAHLMDLLGFEQIGIRENLWFDQENYVCVVCGGKCRCQAVIYQIQL